MRILDWIIGREPVATATGIAAIVTAGLGVAAAFGVDITAEQIAAIGALAAALAGWAGRRAVSPVTTPAERQVTRSLQRMGGLDTPADDGSIPLALVILIGLAVLLLLGLGVCTDALFHDEDEPDDLGQAPVVLISHERDCDDWNGDCGDGYYSGGEYGHNRRDDRNRNRGAFSPGPFDRSPVDLRDNCVSLDCSGRERRGDSSRGDDDRNRMAGRADGRRGLLRSYQSQSGDATSYERRGCSAPRRSSFARAGLQPECSPSSEWQAVLVRGREWQNGSAMDDDSLPAHGRTPPGQDSGQLGVVADPTWRWSVQPAQDALQAGPRIHSREHASLHLSYRHFVPPMSRVRPDSVPTEQNQARSSDEPEVRTARRLSTTSLPQSIGCAVPVPWHCDPKPASLFPPSFEGVKTFVLSTIKSSIELGRLFADTTITFVENLLFGIA